MAEIKFTFNIDKTHAIKAGLREFGAVVRKFDLSALTQDDRDLLARHTDSVHSSDNLSLRSPGNGSYTLTVPGDTVDAVLAALRAGEAEVADKKAKEDADNERRLREAEAEDAETLRVEKTYGRTRGNLYCQQLVAAWLPTAVEPQATVRRSPEWQAVNDRLYAEAVAAKEKREADEAAKKKREKEAQVARAERRAKEIEAWAAAHGSDRLKQCVENGWECDAVYEDERLALEFPGWVWNDDTIPDLDEPRNPPADAVALFGKALATLPEDRRASADLRFWKVKETDEYDGETTTQTGYCVEADPGPWTNSTIVFGYDGPDASDE